MQTLSCKEIDGDLDRLVAKIAADTEPFIITGNENNAVVMISLSEYNSIKETFYLLSNSANAHHLQRSINDLANGKGIEIDLSEL